MSDNEYESFEITDYDLENEFTTNRKRLTKNQQIYGIWADKESDDEEDARPSFKSTRSAKSYTAPIGFIPGGVQHGGKLEEANAGKEQNESEEEDDDANFSKKQLLGTSSSSEEDIGVPIMGKSRRTESIMEGDIAGLRKKGYKPPNALLSQRGVGTWEKHTKGIGAKLLLQMGYQPGKGLGKDLQGIETPIEAKLRKGRGAVGAYGPETHQKQMAKTEEKKIPPKEGTERTSLWRKVDGGKKKKTGYIYKTVEDLLNQSDHPGRKREFNELSKVKVIDMTGPEQRVLSGYHAISGVQKPSDQWDSRKEKQYTNFTMPELLHNLNIIVDMCEQDIINNAKIVKYNEDRLVALADEIDKLENLANEESKTVQTLEKLTSTLEDLLTLCEAGGVSCEDIIEQFEKIKDKYPTEYVIHELPLMVPDLLRVPLKERLESWDPLIDPSEPVPIFAKWKTLLENEVGRVPQTPMHDPYYRLLWESWMPFIRKLVNCWDGRLKAEEMVEVLRAWKPLLPMWIQENILQQLVLPKLQSCIQEWNPLTDTIPVHSWIHPWLPFISEGLHMYVFPVLRQKLGAALNNWHPSDSSARFMLLPWQSIFSQSEMENFLRAHVVPKLSICLQGLKPQEDCSEPWSWVTSWLPLLGENMMAELMDKSFFPKWLQVLSLWLNMAPNYDQISSWYSGWKELVPPPLRDHPRIKPHLRNALELMSRSVGGSSIVQPPPPPPPPPPLISSHSQRFQGMAEAARTSSQMVEGFRDLLAKRCEEMGIVFLPLVNRHKEGKQIYRCGMLQLYIDRNVLFFSDNGTSWQPISLSALLEKAARVI